MLPDLGIWANLVVQTFNSGQFIDELESPVLLRHDAEG